MGQLPSPVSDGRTYLGSPDEARNMATTVKKAMTTSCRRKGTTGKKRVDMMSPTAIEPSSISSMAMRSLKKRFVLARRLHENVVFILIKPFAQENEYEKNYGQSDYRYYKEGKPKICELGVGAEIRRETCKCSIDERHATGWLCI